MNMNALGDDHVSFTASHLAASPDGAYLLVSTDGPRIIMFRIQGVLTPITSHSPAAACISWPACDVTRIAPRIVVMLACTCLQCQATASLHHVCMRLGAQLCLH